MRKIWSQLVVKWKNHKEHKEYKEQRGKISKKENLVLYRFFVYLDESSQEDFWSIGEGGVYGSTIHKAKGREFDHVIVDEKGLFPTVDLVKDINP